MQDSHIPSSRQVGMTTLSSRTEHQTNVSRMFSRGRSPRVEELVSYTDASRLTGLSIHQLQYAARKGDLLAVPLPTGHSALIDSQLRSWAKARERRQ